MTTGKGSRLIVLLAVAFSVTALGLTSWLWFREPIYQGHHLSYWLQGYSPGPFSPSISRVEADAAMDAAGTNAIPTLLRLLSAKDPTWKRKLMSLGFNPRLRRLHITSSLHYNAEAIDGFIRLGSDAQKTVPVTKWISIYERSPSYLAENFTTKAIGDLGPAAKPAIPVLLKMAANTNANPIMRVTAFEALGRIHAPPELVLPALLQAVHDRNAVVRDTAIEYLGPFGADSKAAAAALAKLLSDPDANLRKLALQAIEKLDPDWVAETFGYTLPLGK